MMLLHNFHLFFYNLLYINCDLLKKNWNMYYKGTQRKIILIIYLQICFFGCHATITKIACTFCSYEHTHLYHMLKQKIIQNNRKQKCCKKWLFNNKIPVYKFFCHKLDIHYFVLNSTMTQLFILILIEISKNLE